MQKRTRVEQIWQPQPSGLVTLAGTHSDLSFSSSETFLEIKQKAEAIEKLYFENNITLPPNCDLSRFISDAKLLSDAWLLNSTKMLTIARQFSVVHLNRIADAVISLGTSPACAKYLVALTSGNLDLFQRHKSHAKNILWELELCSSLRKASFDVFLSEPDIVIDLDGSKLAVACKKLYSDKHVQNVLSQAVAQIESNADIGIVALNIDDLVPANSILQMHSIEAVEQFVTQLNNRFLFFHDRHFRKYLTSGRLVSALVSTAVVADIPTVRPRLHNVRRASIWTISGLPTEKNLLLRRFYDQLMR